VSLVRTTTEPVKTQHSAVVRTIYQEGIMAKDTTPRPSSGLCPKCGAAMHNTGNTVKCTRCLDSEKVAEVPKRPTTPRERGPA
jgi:tRNA(Ile2) C34 agmatinyltransferase TiaS